MAERCVAQVVTERDGFGQLLVQPQHFGDRARNLRDLERMREPRPVVIAGRREKHLRLVLQPPKRLAVDDSIAVALKRRPDVVFTLRAEASLRPGALGGLRRENVLLAGLELLPERDDAHWLISARKLVPCGSRPAPKTSLSDWPRSANVFRVPRSTPRRILWPVASSGTYSRE